MSDDCPHAHWTTTCDDCGETLAVSPLLTNEPPHPDYAAYSSHPLHDVDPAVINAARAAMVAAVEANDVSADLADPIADMIVMGIRKYLR